MSSKEWILEAHFGSDFYLINKEHRPHIYNAMDEYARQLSCEFVAWVYIGNYTLQNFIINGSLIWRKNEKDGSHDYNEYQLYDLFIKSKEK